MFCGSCMHDNTWARSLMAAGAEVTLIPTYTPIRVDEDNQSSERVFFGGINIYLEHRWRFWQRLPRWMTRWLDHPRLLDLATRGAVSNDAKQLGDLTLEMLAGDSGPQRQQVEELARFLGDELKPDVICFSNALLAGALSRIKANFFGPVLCTLQGDDIFLDSLTDEYRERVSEQLSEKAQGFDGFLVHSDYYRDYMVERLSLSRERFRRIPLGIDVGVPDNGQTDAVTTETVETRPATGDDFRVGYFARICPEKGLHVLIEAFRVLRKRLPNARLIAGGYLGKRDEAWFEKLIRDARDLGDSFEYIGSPADHESKVSFLKTLDVLSVPTVYKEPKGLFALEAMANGVPVVLPSHGAFPEMLARAGGGVLVEPENPKELAARLEELLTNPANRAELAKKGQHGVREFFSAEVMARESLAVFEEYLDRPAGRHQATSKDADTA